QKMLEAAGDGGLLNLGAAKACARAKQEGGVMAAGVCKACCGGRWQLGAGWCDGSWALAGAMLELARRGPAEVAAKPGCGWHSGALGAGCGLADCCAGDPGVLKLAILVEGGKKKAMRPIKGPEVLFSEAGWLLSSKSLLDIHEILSRVQLSGGSTAGEAMVILEFVLPPEVYLHKERNLEIGLDI
ncbi:hypothetical protein Taro_045285, partial [Colocasia esculenta]|nr:hypothetical protein [Colocasia esculenta]